MITSEIDTKEFDKWFSKAYQYTKRTTDAFIKGKAYSVVSKIGYQIKQVRAEKSDVNEYFENGIKNRGVKLHKKAIERAEAKLSGAGGAYFKTNRGKLGKRLIKLDDTEAGARRDKMWVNAHQLAVRYEWGLRRSGVGSVYAGWVTALRNIKPNYNRIKDADFRHIHVPLKNKASDAWKVDMYLGKYSFTGLFQNEAYKKPQIITAVQAGFNATAQDIKSYLERKLNRSLS